MPALWGLSSISSFTNPPKMTPTHSSRFMSSDSFLTCWWECPSFLLSKYLVCSMTEAHIILCCFLFSLSPSTPPVSLLRTRNGCYSLFIISFYFLFCSTWDQTQGFVHARQLLFHWVTSQLLCSFEAGSWDWPWTCKFPASLFWVLELQKWTTMLNFPLYVWTLAYGWYLIIFSPTK
jgi:hypothetical protein